MTNPTQALDAIEQALQGVLPFAKECKHHENNGKYPGKPVFSFNDVPLTFDALNLIPEALAHIATLKQQVAELVAFREAVTYKISRLKRYSSHKPGREVAFFRFKANMKTGVDRCADVAIWGDVADLVEMLPPAADGGHGGD